MAILHIGREEPVKPTNKCCGMRKWIILFILASLLLSFITATLFLSFGNFYDAPANDKVFWAIFIVFIVIGLLATVLTSAALILNNHLIALSVFATAVLHILLAVPLIVLTHTTGLKGVVVKEIPLLVVFFLQLLFAAVLAITALIAFLEMRKSRSVAVVRASGTGPAVAFMTTVNRSPVTSPVTTRSYQSRSHVSMASSSSRARYLS